MDNQTKSFRLLEESVVDVEGIPFHRFKVESTFLVGSKDWIPIVDRDYGPSGSEDGSRLTRRLYFPRFPNLVVHDLNQRVKDLHAQVSQKGFDGLEGSQWEWKVVLVEYVCPDGVEYIMAGIPTVWDSKICLGVFMKHQIS